MCTLLTKLHSNLGSEQFNSTQRRQRLKDPSNLASSFKQSLAHKRRGCSSGNKRVYNNKYAKYKKMIVEQYLTHLVIFLSCYIIH